MTRREAFLMLSTVSAVNALFGASLTIGALCRGEWWWLSVDVAITATAVWMYSRFRGLYRKEPA